jgi:hypothetical protein
MMPGDTFTSDVEIAVADALRDALDQNRVRLSPRLERRLVIDIIEHFTTAGWQLARGADVRTVLQLCDDVLEELGADECEALCRLARQAGYDATVEGADKW